MPPKRKASTPSSAPAKRARSGSTKPSAQDVYDVSSSSPAPVKRASRRNKAPSPPESSTQDVPKPIDDQKENAPPTIKKRATRAPAQPRASARKPATQAPEPVAKKDVYELSSSSGDEIARPAPPPPEIAATPRTAARRRAKPLMTYSTPGRTRSAGKAGPPKSVPQGGGGDEPEAADPPTPSVKKTPTTKTTVTVEVASSSRRKVQPMPKIDEPVDGGEDEEVEDFIEVREEEGVEVSPRREVPSAMKKTPARTKRPSTGRPSLGVEGLADPFAAPKRVDLDDDEDVAPALPLMKGTPKVVTTPKKTPRKHTPKKDTPKLAAPVPAEEESWDFGVNVEPESVAALQACVLGKITGRTPPKPVGMDEDFEQVHQLLEQTVTAGEGNSMLIIGARGSGKSVLVNTALSQLSAAYPGEFHIVRLNGLLQTDDRLALREIWRQLGVEMDLDENDQPKNTNFADTLASILAILSHPDELQGGEEQTEDPARTSTSVVFILDEFDHFALHPRQTLLYNLFDIAQAKKAPIAVLGLTCKVDVVDSLEKRVKSRFSHRTIHLKLPQSLDAYWDIVKEGLSADPDMGAIRGGNVEAYFEMWNSDYLEKLRTSPSFATLLRRTYNSTKTVAPIFTSTLLPLTNLSPSTPFPPASEYTTTLAPPRSNIDLLPSLSDIQTALLIAAARLEVLVDTDTVNFEMVYDEYIKLCTKTRVQATPSGGSIGRVWSKSIGRAAWESLEKSGLIVDAGRRGGLWRIDVGLMEIRSAMKGSQWLRWCKEVI